MTEHIYNNDAYGFLVNEFGLQESMSDKLDYEKLVIEFKAKNDILLNKLRAILLLINKNKSCSFKSIVYAVNNIDDYQLYPDILDSYDLVSLFDKLDSYEEEFIDEFEDAEEINTYGKLTKYGFITRYGSRLNGFVQQLSCVKAG